MKMIASRRGHPRSRVYMRSALILPLFALAAPAAADDGLVTSRGWMAWIDRAQPSPARLVITARLRLKAPGYRVSLQRRLRQVMIHPPRPDYDLVVKKPAQAAAGAPTWMQFRHVEPLGRFSVKHLVIYYRGRRVAALGVADR